MPLSCSKIIFLRALNECASTPHVIYFIRYSPSNLLDVYHCVKGVIYGRYLWVLSVVVIYGCYLW